MPAPRVKPCHFVSGGPIGAEESAPVRALLSGHEMFVPSSELYPFVSRRFGPLHYLDEGEGRPIVLMHGNPTWSFLYRRLIPLLRAGGLRCIAPDLIGHGLSEHPAGFGYTGAEQAQQIAALIRHLDLRDYVLLGQDWGGPIGLSAATVEPERLGGVALGYTFAWPTTNALTWLVAKVLGSAWGQRKIAAGGFTAWTLRSLLRKPPTEAELLHWTAVHPTPEHRRSLQLLPRELLNRPWLEELERSVRERLGTRPALLFYGGLGELVLGRPTTRFARLFPQHRVVPLGRSGHYFQEDTPEPVARELLAFARAPVTPRRG